MRIVTEKDIEPIILDSSTALYNYFTKADNDNVSLVVLKMNGDHVSVINTRSIKIYFVLSGVLRFQTNEETYILNAGDALCLQPNQWYSTSGTNCSVLVISSPAFSEHDEITKPIGEDVI